MHVLFILPGQGGGGGSHSVVQESIGLQRFGVEVTIATTVDTLGGFHAAYPELGGHRISVVGFSSPTELALHLRGPDVAVSTTYESVHMLADALQGEGQLPIRTAYYVQDYEPLFYPPGSPRWERAVKSYTLLSDQMLFAKTHWLCELVSANHGRKVRKVLPSLDHATYFPGVRPSRRRMTITAMMRPTTLRRAPRRTARTLEKLAAKHGDAVEVIAFGSPAEELAQFGIRLSERIGLRGRLTRQEVAAVLRESDVFLDLSDYQAFGRTGLEGMACGCIPILPKFGGAHEYARNWANSVLVDTRDDEAIMTAIDDLLALGARSRREMRDSAIQTSLNYSIEKAAFSELQAFSEILN